VRYKIPLVDSSGRVVEITAYGLDKITTSMDAVDPRDMHAVVPEAPAGKLQRAAGKVEILVGQDNLRLFPVEVRRVGDAALHRSQFGSGWIASGKLPEREEARALCALVADAPKEKSRSLPAVPREGGIFVTVDFLTAEALGTDLPRICKSCLSCKERQFRTDSTSFKENQEYQVILEGLSFDKERKKWTASYPFCIPPSELRDNYQQVLGYTASMEKSSRSKAGRKSSTSSSTRR
jgi:hypothetical protein